MAPVFSFSHVRERGGGGSRAPFLSPEPTFFLSRPQNRPTHRKAAHELSTRSLVLRPFPCVPSLHGHRPLPIAAFTFSTRRARFNKPLLFMDLPGAHFRFYSLLPCKEDIISSPLSTHTVVVTMGTWEPLCSQQRPGLLHCAERQQLSLPLAGKQAH